MVLKLEITEAVPLSTHHHFKDLTGRRFGRLVVQSYLGKHGAYRYWDCLCDCGQRKEVQTSCLTRGFTDNCGCISHTRISKAKITHGLSNTRVYLIWSSMRKRCQNSKSPDYPLYGGRGICVCERWDTFENFFADMGHPPSPQHSLDRIDPNGNYEPSNCRWATASQQACNRRTIKLIEVNGERLTAPEWDRRMGYRVGTVKQRISQNWEPQRAVLTPIQDKRVFLRMNRGK